MNYTYECYRTLKYRDTIPSGAYLQLECIVESKNPLVRTLVDINTLSINMPAT